MNKRVTVYVNGETWDALRHWTLAFEAVFDGTTTVRARGTWMGETEAVNMVSHLYDSDKPDFLIPDLRELVAEYKREAGQHAALVTYEYVDVVALM